MEGVTFSGGEPFCQPKALADLGKRVKEELGKTVMTYTGYTIERLIPKNPTEGTIIPKVNYAPKQILTEEQLEKFMEALKQDPLWYDFFYTELTTGMRRGEICGLKWQE